MTDIDTPAASPAAPEGLDSEAPGKDSPGPESSGPEAAEAAAGDDQPTYLIDGSGYIFRAFHALPMMNRRSDGVPVNAVYGYTAMLMKLLGELKARRVAVVFDAARANYRHEIFAEYKANRPETPDELAPQFPLIREATAAFALPCIELEGFEADDVIATYCRQAREQGRRVVVVSADKDLMQLVGQGVTMLDPIKNRPIDETEVIEKFGVPPSQVADVQALCGDPTDNVPGVPGIGIKTAAQLIAKYGSLDALLDRAAEIRQPKRRESLIQFADQARLSKRLVLLDDRAPVTSDLADIVVHAPDRNRLLDFLRAQEFRTLATRVETQWPFDDLPAAAPARAGVAGGPAAGEAGEPDYAVIRDAAALDPWIAGAYDEGVVAVNVETAGDGGGADRPVGIALALAPGRACYVPFRSDEAAAGTLALEPGPATAAMRCEDVLDRLRPLLQDPSVLKVLHDAKAAWRALGGAAGSNAGVELGPLDDTLLLSYVLDGTRNGIDLGELAGVHLGVTMRAPRASLLGSGRTRIAFAQVPVEQAARSAAEAADLALRLHRALKRRLVPEHMTAVYETMERRLPPVVGRMEREGVRVDPGVLGALSAEFATRLHALEGEVFALVGHEFNIGSPKQLGEVLFDELGLPGGKRVKTGGWSTHAEVLEPLAAQGHDVAAKVLEWRGLSKLKGTYTDALPGQIDGRTGRVHTRFDLASTNTGRLSSNDPNLQNIPIRTEEGRKIRAAFVAGEGHRLVSVDYSQIELRLVAHIAGIAVLRQAFHDGVDVHAATAAQVFGLGLDQITPDIRRKAKTINFGIIYGISGWGLAVRLGIPQAEANAFIKTYLQRFPEFRDWMDRVKAECRERGHVCTLFGRKCPIPGIRDPNPARRGFAERQAINAPIQGTAADIMKRAMVRMPEALAAEGLSARLLLQVHDELLFEAPEAEAEATAAAARRVMEAAARPHLPDLPLVAEAGIGRSWAEAH